MIKLKNLLMENLILEQNYIISTHYEVSDDLMEFMENIGKAIAKHFPKSYISVDYSKSFHASITVKFTLGKEKKNYVNGIWNNDPAIQTFSIDSKDGVMQSGQLPEKMNIDSYRAGSFMVTSENPLYVYDSIKVGWRKKSNVSPEKIIQHLDNFFGKLKKSIWDNKDKLSNTHKQVLTNYPELQK